MKKERIIEQVDKMVRSGRITPKKKQSDSEPQKVPPTSTQRLATSALGMPECTWRAPSPKAR